jgi:hypothetical protein
MLRIFPSAEIRCLCGDREFIGQAWLRYLLLEPMLAFCLRIGATDKIEYNGKRLTAKVIFAHLAIAESQRLQGSCLILNSLSIGYISGQAKGKRQKAKEGIDNQFLITGFSIIIWGYPVSVDALRLPDNSGSSELTL